MRPTKIVAHFAENDVLDADDETYAALCRSLASFCRLFVRMRPMKVQGGENA